MMTGLAATSTGTVTMFGEPVRDNPPLYRRIGVMSEHETVYDFMTGREFVSMMARIRNVGNIDKAVDHSIELVEMIDAQHRAMKTYSRGMRQRMRLAATLVHDPEVLILDEPLNGADPRQRLHFKRLLQQLAHDGRTIILSSHILEEVEELADTVLLIVNGKLAASGGFRAIRAALNQRPYHVRVVSDSPRALAAAVVNLPSVDAVNIDPDGALIVLSRNVLDLQLELPRLAQSASIRLRRVGASRRFAAKACSATWSRTDMGTVYRLTLRQLTGRLVLRF